MLKVTDDCVQPLKQRFMNIVNSVSAIECVDKISCDISSKHLSQTTTANLQGTCSDQQIQHTVFVVGKT